MATTRLLSAMVATWNNVATTFTGLKLNVTDTASAAGSLLMDLQVGGVSKFNVDKDGLGTFGAGVSALSLALRNNTTAIFLGTDYDVALRRDAANTLALRNGTAAQKFNVYNTYTDASNYERASIGWSGNQFLITTYSTGTGAGRSMFVGTTNSYTSVFLGTAGAERWEVNGSGHLLAATDNTYDIGASGANRPRNVYVANNLQAEGGVSVGALTVASNSYISWAGGKSYLMSGASGDMTLYNASGALSTTFTVGASNLLTLNGGLKTTGATFALQTATTLTDNAAAQVATMTNGPAAGNPTKWIAINDNGVTRYIPAW